MRSWFLAVTAALVSCSYDWSPGSGADDGDGATGNVDGDAGERDGTTGDSDADAGCEPGFQREGGECVDRDECLADNGGCAQVCTNGPGSFTCSCDPGHTLGAGGTCTPFVWGEPVLLEARDNAGERPQVVVDREGRATVAWVAGFDGVWANRYEPGAGWRGAVAVDTASGNARSPSLGVTDDDTVLLLWDGTATDTSVWAARMLGGSWEAPVQLDTGARLARVATHGGRAAAAWIRIGTERGNLASSRYSATAGWSSARLLETPGTDKAYSVQIALGADGVARASWDMKVNADRSAWSSHDDGAGTWSAAATIESSAEIVVEDSTLIASGGGGLVVAAWLQAGAGNVLNSWASSLKPDGTWAAAEPLRDAEGLSGQVAVLEVGDDGSAWAAGARNGVWASRYVDGTWGAALPLDDGGSDVDLAIGPNGDAVAAWIKGNDVWSASYRARTGTWSAPTLVEYDNFGAASQPEVALDGEGHAIIAWVQARDGHGDIWAARLDPCDQPNGCTVAWPPRCADDGAGGCTCPAGWTPGPDGTCVDVDECALNSDGCDADPDACHNREGGFYCACPNGYIGTGVTDAGCMSNVLDPWS